MLHRIIKPLVSVCMILQFFFSQAIDEKDVDNAINTFMTFVEFPDDIEDGNKETEGAFREILYDMLHKKPRLNHKEISSVG